MLKRVAEHGITDEALEKRFSCICIEYQEHWSFASAGAMSVWRRGGVSADAILQPT